MVDLSLDSLLAEARERTGLSDFGEDGYRERLVALLAGYEAAGLSPGGRKATRRRLVELLANRLQIQATLQAHPEIHRRQLRRPIYLTGLPRTGTSALFNLLAADPATRALLYWEGVYPQPPARPLAPGEEDPRKVALRASLERAAQRNPEMAKIHQVSVDGPEECVQLLAHTMGFVQNGIEPLLPPYREDFLRQDLRPIYAYYADLLRLVDWQRPGERWLLKSPAHLWALDLIVDELPEACFVWTHRNPLQIIGSYCSMMLALMSIREHVEPRELGPQVLEYLARSVERGMEVREQRKLRVVDVDYHRFVQDPVATAENIYAAFELPLAPSTHVALQQHVADHPQNKHGSHSYTLEKFGLTGEDVRRRLARYIERFEVPAT